MEIERTGPMKFVGTPNEPLPDGEIVRVTILNDNGEDFDIQLQYSQTSPMKILAALHAIRDMTHQVEQEVWKYLNEQSQSC